MRLNRFILFVFISLLLCRLAAAQGSAEYNHGIAFGKVGWSNVYQTATLGPTSVVDNEMMVAGGVEIRPIRTLRQLGFEFEASRMPQSESGFGVTPTSGSVAFFVGNAVYHLAKGRAQPYVFGGAGIIVRKENLAIPTGTFHGRVFTVGVGMDIGLTPHWFIRTEGGLYAPRIFDKVFTVSGGLAYHW